MLDSPDHNAPDFKIIFSSNPDGLEILIGWAQFYITVFFVAHVEIPDSKLTIDTAYYNIAIPWFKGTIYDCYVIVADACFYHGISLYLTIECGFRIVNKVTVEIQCFVTIVFCR